MGQQQTPASDCFMASQFNGVAPYWFTGNGSVRRLKPAKTDRHTKRRALAGTSSVPKAGVQTCIEQSHRSAV